MLGRGSGNRRSDRWKPTPEAARTEAWASSWPEDKEEPGTPPSAPAFGKLVTKLAAGVAGRFEACNCSAASACLTAVTMEAKKAEESWSKVRDWDVAGGSDEPVLGKLEFTANVLMTAAEFMAWNSAAWLLCVDLDVIILAISFPTKQEAIKPSKNPQWFAIAKLFILKDQPITLHVKGMNLETLQNLWRPPHRSHTADEEDWWWHLLKFIFA